MRSRPALFAILLGLGGAGVAASIIFVPMGAMAASSVELSMSDLVDSSTLVVAGTPLDSRSLWEGDAQGRRIVTYTRVRVDRTIDGTPHGEVWIRTLGGEVDDIGQQVAGEANLRTAEPTLLFLHDRTDGTHVVVGMAQGQYLLEVAQGAAVRVRAPREAHLLLPKAGVTRSASSSARSALAGHTLDEVAELVAAARRAHAP